MGHFTFKRFEVDDSHCGMKIGTDSVLLGAWAPVESRRLILDAGAGCGIIALMLAQRAPQAIIHAVEIDPQAAGDAAENIRHSQWSDRIDLLIGDVLDPAVAGSGYDLIVSNPPFFNETLRSPDSSRAIARHGNGFDVVSLLTLASAALAPGGLLAFVAPVARDGDIKFNAALARLHLQAHCDIRQRPSRPVVRRLYLFSRQGTEVSIPVLPASIDINGDDGTPTADYKSLTRDFYLNF